MPLVIRLLGVPSIERDGVPVRLSGRKPWVLLAMLALERRPLTRQELIDRLTPEADDPQAALRWVLHTVRRALGPEAMVTELDGRLQLEYSDSVCVDVIRLAEGLDDYQFDEAATGALLDGLRFDDEPSLAFWLSMERTRLKGAVAEALWWTATTVASTDPDRSMRLVRHGLTIDPYCETKHELLIELLLQQGDVLGARAHAEATARLYRDELGEDLPASIRRPLERRPPQRADVPAPSIRGLLQVGQARFAAGDPDRAADAARRAADAALHGGNRELELASLSLLSRILIHAHRGSVTDAKGLLSRTTQLATDLGDNGALADALREMGFIMILEGNYGAADPLLARSIRMAARLGDVRRSAQALVYRALGQSDRCDYQAASGSFEAAIEAFATSGDAAWRGYAEGLFARMFLQAGDVATARDLARVATQRIREAGWTAVLPWPLLIEAECDLRAGGVAAAADLFGEALTLSAEVGDPCCEGLALRGLALARTHTGDRTAAIDLLESALSTVRRFGAGYARAAADILADLVEINGATVGAAVEDARLLSTSGPMPDIAARLRRSGQIRTQTLAQTASA